MSFYFHKKVHGFWETVGVIFGIRSTVQHKWWNARRYSPTENTYVDTNSLRLCFLLFYFAILFVWSFFSHRNQSDHPGTKVRIIIMISRCRAYLCELYLQASSDQPEYVTFYKWRHAYTLLPLRVCYELPRKKFKTPIQFSLNPQKINIFDKKRDRGDLEKSVSNPMQVAKLSKI